MMLIRQVSVAAIAATCFIVPVTRAASGSQIPDPVTAADPMMNRVDIEGAFKAPPPGAFAAPAAAVAPVVDQPVVATAEPAPVPVAVGRSTRCGLNVLSTSEHAVGDPCATTADVMASLNLSRAQIAYVEAHSGMQNLAH